MTLLNDFVDEDWRSMDVVGEMLHRHLAAISGISVNSVRPSMMRFSREPLKSGFGRKIFNAERLINRFLLYPILLRGKPSADIYHVVDHSYAHLVSHLPASRTVVTCHDIDAFRCLFDADPKRQSSVLTSMAKHILAGLRKAAHVFCVSRHTSDELTGIVGIDPGRVSVVPNGINPLFSPLPDSAADRWCCDAIGPASSGGLELLHVSSPIPRKRIDLLLRILARLKDNRCPVRLVRVGGALNDQQQRLASDLGVVDLITTLPQLTVPQLAAVYRRADLLVSTSDREGFGLPLVEAMACGTTAVTSDISAFREIGGPIHRCPSDDVDEWARLILAVESSANNPSIAHRRREECLAHSLRFSWASAARQLADTYAALPRVHAPVLTSSR